MSSVCSIHKNVALCIQPFVGVSLNLWDRAGGLHVSTVQPVFSFEGFISIFTPLFKFLLLIIILIYWCFALNIFWRDGSLFYYHKTILNDSFP